jgi:hypothetical protein
VLLTLAFFCAVLCFAAAVQLSATEVDPKLNFDAIHTWIQSLGFRKAAAAAGEGLRG